MKEGIPAGESAPKTRMGRWHRGTAAPQPKCSETKNWRRSLAVAQPEANSERFWDARSQLLLIVNFPQNSMTAGRHFLE